MDRKLPNVGVGVIVFNLYGQILLGKRKGSHGAGEWSFPGGKLEWFEPVSDCCQRELREETGLTDVDCICKIGWSEDHFPSDDKHYITLYVLYRLLSGEPKLMEPDKCEGWGWFDLHNLPSPLWTGLSQHVLEVEKQIDICLAMA